MSLKHGAEIWVWELWLFTALVCTVMLRKFNQGSSNFLCGIHFVSCSWLQATTNSYVLISSLYPR